jgi:phospholipase C
LTTLALQVCKQALINNTNTLQGCEKPNVNCFPLNWTTVPEYHESAGVSWQVYQNVDNFGDDPLYWFSQFQSLSDNSTLSERGLAYLGLDAFYEAAANGTLPTVSWIVGPAELSEHPYVALCSGVEISLHPY